MKKPVVIFGMGEFARVAYAYLTGDGGREVAAFTVHERQLAASTLLGRAVVPYERLRETHPPDQYAMLVAVGFKRLNHARAEIYDACKRQGYEFVSYVSPRAALTGEVEIGEHCVILEQNVLQPFVKIGHDVVLWSGNHIGHDVEIGNHCFVASHAVISGGSRIGPYCFIGVNATIGDHVTVAPECVIGAGALILQDTRPQGVYAVKGTRAHAARSTDLKAFR